jgi:sulfatase modifying factor 1
MRRHIASILVLAVIPVAFGACHRTEDLGKVPDAGGGSGGRGGTDVGPGQGGSGNGGGDGGVVVTGTAGTGGQSGNAGPCDGGAVFFCADAPIQVCNLADCPHGPTGTAGAGGGGNQGGGGGSGAAGGGTVGTTGGGGGRGGSGGATGGGGGLAPPTMGPSCNGDFGTGPQCGNAENCCATILVPGGTFKRGYDGVYNVDAGNPATVSPFYLDKYEVTVGRYRVFIGAGWSTQSNPPPDGAGANPHVPNSGWKNTWKTNLATSINEAKLNATCDSRSSFQANASYEQFPVPCLNWYEAFAFCAWDGGRLPTEAEWNFAAAGGDEQRVYPWSNPPSVSSITDTQAVYHANTVVAGGGPPFGVAGTKPAGAGKWGHLDLAGNMYEWLLDFENGAYVLPCVDCADLNTAGRRRTAGGFWNSPAEGVVAGGRSGDNPAARSLANGVRCVRLQ